MLTLSNAASQCVAQSFVEKVNVDLPTMIQFSADDDVAQTAVDMLRLALQMGIDAGMSLMEAANLVMASDYASCIPLIN